MKIVVEANEGKLDLIPFPRLLHHLFSEVRTGVLTVVHTNVTKKIYVGEGWPVASESTLHTEQLTQILQRDKLLKAEQEQQALIVMSQSGRPITEVLVELGYVDAIGLFKALRRTMAVQLFDCFNWKTGSYVFEDGDDWLESKVALKVHPGRLVVQGTLRINDELLKERFDPEPSERFMLHPRPVYDYRHLNLSVNGKRVVNALVRGATLAEVVAAAGVPEPEVRRTVYGLQCLELVAEASEVQSVVATPEAAPGPAVELESNKEADEKRAKEEAQAKSDIAAEYMRVKNIDPFGMLGVDTEATNVQVKQAYLAKTEKFAPARYLGMQIEEVRDQLEDVFCKLARSYVVLCDYEMRQTAVRQLENARKASDKSGEKRPGASFVIKTKLLDGREQMRTAMDAFKAGQWDKAIEHFNYVLEMDDNPNARAHAAYARFLKSPEVAGDGSLKELNKLIAAAPNNDIAYHFAGLIHQQRGERVEAAARFREALRANPRNSEARDALRGVQRA